MQACRTCLKLIDASQCKYFEIEGEDVQLTASSVRYKILSIVPEMALNIVKPSIICEPCHKTLESLFAFKSTCMKTENMIMHYLNTTVHINPAVLNLRSVAILYKTGYVKDPVLQSVIDLEKCIDEVPVKEEVGENSEVSEDNSQDSFVDDENITIVKHEVTNYDSEIVEIHPPDNKVLCMINKDENLICNEMEIEVAAKENKEVDLKTIHSSNPEQFQIQKEDKERKIEESKPIKCDITHIPSSIPVSVEAIDNVENIGTSDAQSNECSSKAGPDITVDASKNKVATEKKENNEFKCKVCLKNFVSRFRLKAHMLCHTDERPYKCTSCPKAFNDRSTLNKHLKIHTGIKEYQCDICQREFYCRGNLNKHALTHSGERPFKCEVCEKEFSRNEHLKQHKLIHTGEKLFECNLCIKKFARRDSLIVHMMVHTGERNYVCAYCNKRCIDSSTLKKHLRSHTGDKPYECEVCKNRFTQKTHLTIHKRKHTGERPYHCDICGKNFFSNNYLKIHIRTHTKEKPYTCEVCLRKFSTLSNLSMHRKIHIGKRDFHCASCTKSFIHKHDLKKHVLVHAQEKPFSCHICKKSFSKKMRAKSHILNQHKHVDINTIVFERYKTTVLGQEGDDDKNKSKDSNLEVENLKDEPKMLVNGELKTDSLI